MTTEPDPALTGAEFELANGGYRSMPDPEEKHEEEAIGSDSGSLREVAERLSGPRDEVIVRKYTDGEGKPVAPNEAVSLERAGRDYARATAADRLLAENATSQALAARVDALRAEALAQDPDAADLYGFEPPQVESDKPETAEAEAGKIESAEADGDLAQGELDPEIEKALQHPQVRQAIEQQIDEVEKTRQSYLDGLAAATQIAQVSFLSQFPELASIAPEQLPGVLEQMSQQDLAKFARVQAMVATTEQLFTQQQQEGRRQAEMAQHNFLAFAKSEDARLETTLKGEPKAIQHAVSAEIVASAKASGVEPAELFRLFNSEPLMRNAVFQRLMYDAGKYRLMMKAKDAAAAKPVPPVQRPGMARTPAEREHADLRTLSTKLSSSATSRMRWRCITPGNPASARGGFQTHPS
jgi:hypothetical protein